MIYRVIDHNTASYHRTARSSLLNEITTLADTEDINE